MTVREFKLETRKAFNDAMAEWSKASILRH